MIYFIYVIVEAFACRMKGRASTFLLVTILCQQPHTSLLSMSWRARPIQYFDASDMQRWEIL